MIEVSEIPLTGKALLQKIKECAHLPKRKQAMICGYYAKDRVNLVDFYEAFVEARGIALDPEQSKDRRGREPTHRVSVHKNGQIVIGSTYTQSMGLSPGDEFEIRLGYKHIHLHQISQNGYDQYGEKNDSDEEDLDVDLEREEEDLDADLDQEEEDLDAEDGEEFEEEDEE